MAIFYAPDLFFLYSNQLETVPLPRLDPYFIYFLSEYADSEVVKQLLVPVRQPKKTILLIMFSCLSENCIGCVLFNTIHDSSVSVITGCCCITVCQLFNCCSSLIIDYGRRSLQVIVLGIDNCAGSSASRASSRAASN